MRTERSGQAMIEMAIGVFAMTLVLASLLTFAAYILKAMSVHRDLRAKVGRAALTSADGGLVVRTERESVEVEPFSADYAIGTERLRIQEKVALPGMSGL